MEIVTEEEILETIKFREELIKRCLNLIQITNNNKNNNLNGITAREYVNISKELRLCGLRCVQKIIIWCLNNSNSNSDSPTVFLYNGEEYLCKMLTDLDFIYESINPTMRQHGGFGLG